MNKRSHIFGILIVMATFNTSADEMYKYLRTTCAPEVGYFEMTPAHLWNIGDLLNIEKSTSNEELQSTYNLHPEGRGSITCDIGHEVNVEYSSTESRAKGVCGAGTRTFVDIRVDGILVAKQIAFDEDCKAAGTTKISIQKQQSLTALRLTMHSKGPKRGPRMTYTQSFILYLDKGEFLSNRIGTLPIDMDYLAFRMEELAL